jgi:hypothetical protein
MKTQLLFIAVCLSSILNAQSITFTSSVSEVQIGTTVTINYQYTIPADGNIYCAINLYDDSAWSSMVADGSLSPAPAGTDVTGSFDFTIPTGTTQTSGLTGNFNYKLVIELSDSGWNWLSGDYPATQINLTNTPLSVNDLENTVEQISIYPNPAKNTIQITNFYTFTNPTVKIFSILGKEVYASKALNSAIDVAMLKSGIYLVRIQSENKVETVKFIKQ